MPLIRRSTGPLVFGAMAYCTSTESVQAWGGGNTVVNLAQYNVLSDSLDSPDHYLYCDPKDLEEATRFKRVVAQLEVKKDEKESAPFRD